MALEIQIFKQEKGRETLNLHRFIIKAGLSTNEGTQRTFFTQLPALGGSYFSCKELITQQGYLIGNHEW